MEKELTSGVTGTPNFYRDVIDWIQEYQPELIDDTVGRVLLYDELCNEEFKELTTAVQEGDIVGNYDGMCDVIRTAYGKSEIIGNYILDNYIIPYLIGSLMYNINCFHECREEIKRSNRTKSKDRREDGKIIKGPNYQAPNLLQIIKKYHDIKNT